MATKSDLRLLALERRQGRKPHDYVRISSSVKCNFTGPWGGLRGGAMDLMPKAFSHNVVWWKEKGIEFRLSSWHGLIMADLSANESLISLGTF